ncbi:MAG TPA: hypothetical protein VIW29_10255, partial [Polyangiaceae bacterium]
DATRGLELDREAGPGVTLSTGSLGGSGQSFGLELSGGAFGDDNDFELIQTGSKVELAGAVTQATAQRVDQSASWPSGRSRAVDQLPIDSAEVALVADYGAGPQSALTAPLYAYRVYARRGPLKRLLAEHAAALEGAEAERDTALARLAGELRPRLEASDGFRRVLEPVRELERVAGDRSAALSQADAGYREQMARFDTELVPLESALTKARAAGLDCQAQAEASESQLRRAEAKLKRVQIEIRGVLDLARQAVGPAGGNIPPAQAAQLAELQARFAALEPEVNQVRAADAGVLAALAKTQAEQRAIESQLAQLARQKTAAGATLEKQLSARAAGVSEAEQQRREALAEVARAVLAARGTISVPEATLVALREHDRRVDERAVRLETHLRALDSYDRERARQGVIYALSALGLVVLAIVLKAVL